MYKTEIWLFVRRPLGDITAEGHRRKDKMSWSWETVQHNHNNHNQKGAGH